MDVVEVRIEHSRLPSFRLHGGGGALRAAITHYKAIAVLQVTMSWLCLKVCPKGVPRSSLYRRLDLGLQGVYVSGKYTES